MSTAIDVVQPSFDVVRPSFAARVLDGSLAVPLPDVNYDVSLSVIVSDFNCGFSAALTHFSSVVNSTTVIAEAVIDKHVSMTLTLTGKLAEGETSFQIKETSLRIKPTRELARADFVASTLNALLSLAQEVELQVPEIALDLNSLSFDLPLYEISQLLQTRQTAYRLMVIERATGTQFLLPSRFSGDQMTQIIFAYRAIVERSFYWPFESYPLRVSANEEWLNRIMSMNEPAPITFTLGQEEAEVLGEPILLGNVKVTVEDGLIQNLDRVKQDLARLDGHEFEVIIKSASDQAKFELLEAPRLPDNPWEPNIQALVDLESQLDARLCEEYNALAAATLDGLTEKEKVKITARPELDEEAFLIKDWNQEDS